MSGTGEDQRAPQGFAELPASAGAGPPLIAGSFAEGLSEQVRAAQLAALPPRLRGTVVSMGAVMVGAFIVQMQIGFGWIPLAWQLAMALLAGVVVRKCLARDDCSCVRAVSVFAGLYGTVLALGLSGWARELHPELSALLVAAALTTPAYAVVGFYFIPAAVVAFCLPLFASALVLSVTMLPGPAARTAVVLILAHGAGMAWFLRRNWDHFVQVTEVAADKARLAEMLREQKEIAEHAVQQKMRFLAATSHDLRQPMHAISLYLSGLSELDLPARARRAVDDARECARDLSEMFRSLLDISRLDAHQAVPNLSVFSIGTVLERVEKELAPIAQSHGVRLKVRPCAAHVYSDAVMVERIALNFVSNAVRHADSSRVLVVCRVHGQTLRLAVLDNGRGIPEAQQQAIFDEYHRLEDRGRTDRGGGLGLGLAIVRRLAQTLHVPVLLRSAPGRGSMFAVELPLVQTATAVRELPEGETGLAGRLVVLVDDELSILEAATFILETAGCTVVAAPSGAQALQALAASTRVPDALVCDYELEDNCTGPEVIRALREEFNCDIPALMVTGDTSGTAETQARQMGLALLYKPLDAAALRRSLESILRREVN